LDRISGGWRFFPIQLAQDGCDSKGGKHADQREEKGAGIAPGADGGSGKGPTRKKETSAKTV